MLKPNRYFVYSEVVLIAKIQVKIDTKNWFLKLSNFGIYKVLLVNLNTLSTDNKNHHLKKVHIELIIESLKLNLNIS